MMTLPRYALQRRGTHCKCGDELPLYDILGICAKCRQRRDNAARRRSIKRWMLQRQTASEATP